MTIPDTTPIPGCLAQPSLDVIRAVSPALARYTSETLHDDVWHRPGLGRRDRSIVTVAALIARQQLIEMPSQFARALDHGVTPAELSEIVTHLAFYAGWPNAMAAVVVAHEVFSARGIDATQLPPARPELLPLDEEAEARRATAVNASAGPVSEGVVHYTAEALFKDLWLRPDLKPRDRSLVTVAALIANGQVAQIPYHLNRAMDNGLTQAEASEVLTHLAFHVGWPNVFSAIPVAKGVFEGR
ncbi:carboxymuconolactone decarboxylase family protein [Bacillus sp. NP157]|nr:carboxymuconolactone decarboxylase family protein [Bacillus sp. NP157]